MTAVTRSLGLVAGNGKLPGILAQAAAAQGFAVHAVGLKGEADPSLASRVASLTWMPVGRLNGIIRALKARGVQEAVLAGGIGRMRAAATFRPDTGALRVLLRLGSFRDDELLRSVAYEFERQGVAIAAPQTYLVGLLAPEGLLAGPALSARDEADIRLGCEVAHGLGASDVGHTVVVKAGTVLAVEAVEGTDACIRRAAKLGGAGVVVVKRRKPRQDTRFDLPTIGPITLEVAREARARVLSVQAQETIMLDAPTLLALADRLRIALVGTP